MILSVLPPSMYSQQGLWSSKSRRRTSLIVPVTAVFCVTVFTFLAFSDTYSCRAASLVKKYDRPYSMHTNVVIRKDGKVFKYDRSSPLVFISGVNLSGSELLRDILDSHPDVRCIADHFLIPRMLRLKHAWFTHKNESVRLIQAGLSSSVMDTAIGAFSLEILARSGKPAEYLCNQDFRSMKYADHLATIFPQSKFLLVVRDPIHYAYKKHQEHHLKSFNETLFKQYLQEWDEEMVVMKTMCREVSLMTAINNHQPRCRIIHYETLFLRPKLVTLSVLKFISPNGSFNHIPHSMLSKLQPGMNDDLREWFGFVPKRVVTTLEKEQYRTVTRFDYGHVGYPPNYHLLPDEVE